MNQPELGQRIRQLRVAHELRQIDLAYDLQVATSTISKWERGRSTPSPPMIDALAKVLNVDRSDLLEELTIVDAHHSNLLNERRQLQAKWYSLHSQMRNARIVGPSSVPISELDESDALSSTEYTKLKNEADELEKELEKTNRNILRVRKVDPHDESQLRSEIRHRVITKVSGVSNALEQVEIDLLQLLNAAKGVNDPDAKQELAEHLDDLEALLEACLEMLRNKRLSLGLASDTYSVLQSLKDSGKEYGGIASILGLGIGALALLLTAR